MKHYTKQLMLFKDISGKKIEIDFDGGDMSSDAGVLFLRETESDIGIIRKVAEAIVDKRHPSYVKHKMVHLLTQRVFQIASGYEDGNDSNELRNDPVFKMACDKLPASDDSLASQPTMCRFENTPSRTTLYRIAGALLDGVQSVVEDPLGGALLAIEHQHVDERGDRTKKHPKASF